jgi:hypothetical protein
MSSDCAPSGTALDRMVQSMLERPLLETVEIGPMAGLDHDGGETHALQHRGRGVR